MANKKTTQKFQVGVIGGGQLARMLVQKGQELGLRVLVLSDNPDDPAAQVTKNWMKGSVKHPSQVAKFLSLVKVITYESEFVPVEKLGDLINQHQAKSYPKIKHMSILQQRWSQKEWLEQQNIPTSPWVSSESITDYRWVASQLDSPKFVIKKNMGGYDGYGTFIISNERQFRRVCKDLRERKTSFIAEKFVPFKRELAMTFARSSNGDIVNFPLVESFQTDSRCDWVKGPISETPFKPVLNRIKAALQKIGYVGVIAFEFFEVAHGQLLVNEVAPRVHNSSHYSLNGFSEDQFSMHLKAILGQQLTRPFAYSKGFAMKNLIGSGRKVSTLATDKPVHLHWYGKTENRKGRKMGHINGLSTTPEKALKLTQTAERDMKI